MTKMPLDTMGDTFLPRILLWQDFSVVVTSRLLVGREDVMTIVFQLFWVAWMDLSYSGWWVRLRQMPTSEEALPTLVTRFIPRTKCNYSPSLQNPYFARLILLTSKHTLYLIGVFVYNFWLGFHSFFCNWHTLCHTMMGTDLLLVIQIYRIPKKLPFVKIENNCSDWIVQSF